MNIYENIFVTIYVIFSATKNTINNYGEIYTAIELWWIFTVKLPQIFTKIFTVKFMLRYLMWKII